MTLSDMLLCQAKRLMLAALLLLPGASHAAPCGTGEADPPPRQPAIIAHRCYNAAESAPENSLEALRAALRRDYLYAVEMDVWITADGVVVVHHDDSIDGVSLERSRYDELQEHKLANGEPLPTLASFFEQLRETPGIKAVIEIKEHADTANGRRAADAIVQLVRAYGLEKQVEYQSFDSAICRQVMLNAPDAAVGYPRGDVPPAALPAQGFRIMDYHYGDMFSKPRWIREAQQSGLSANVYTLNSCADMLHAANLGIDGITTDFPEALRAVLKWREHSTLHPLLTNQHLTWALSALRNTPLALVYALQDSASGAASALQRCLHLHSLSLTQFFSLLSGVTLLLAFATSAWVALRRKEFCPPPPEHGGRLRRVFLSFSSPCGRISPLAFWWHQLALTLPLYLCTCTACLAGTSGQALCWLDEASVLSVLLSQVCPTGLLASGLACVQVHYAGGSTPASPLVTLSALPCLMLSLLAAWCCLSLVLRRLRDSRAGLWAFPLCLTLLWTQFIMLTKHRPVWLDDALIALVLLMPVVCLSLPSRKES